MGNPWQRLIFARKPASLFLVQSHSWLKPHLEDIISSSKSPVAEALASVRIFIRQELLNRRGAFQLPERRLGRCSASQLGQLRANWWLLIH